jgi:hypothetical protein
MCTAVALLLCAGMPVFAHAGDTIVTLDADAETPPSTAQLTISPSTINFPNANPGTVPVIASIPSSISVTANAQIDALSWATLTVRAGGDLASGSNTIPISNVTWTATGDGFIAGTMSKDDPVSAGSWQGPGEHSGTFSFHLANSWSYATGNYSQTVTYTLTAP